MILTRSYLHDHVQPERMNPTIWSISWRRIVCCIPGSTCRIFKVELISSAAKMPFQVLTVNSTGKIGSAAPCQIIQRMSWP